MKELEFISYDPEDEHFNDGIVEVIKVIDKRCPNLEELWLHNFVGIEIVNDRFVHYNVCKVYHLKKQCYLFSRNCPYQQRNVSKTSCCWRIEIHV